MGLFRWGILLMAACAARPIVSAPRAGEPLRRRGDEIMVCGELFHTSTRVVLWNDFGGYDAYRPQRRFDSGQAKPSGADTIARYGSFRRDLPAAIARRVRAKGWRLDDLRRVVTQVVIHYDAAGTSRNAFRVLQDVRGLSAHFLLDLDGTIYQTLDLKERAWHAGKANDRSIGIEIANIGAYSDRKTLDRWYGRDAAGTRVTLPSSLDGGGLPAGFVARPARPDPIRGKIHGRVLVQYDFTDEQYEALGRLLAALSRILPRIPPRAPEARTALSDPTRPGYVGHYHLTRRKIDPGPAFDWDRVLKLVRKRMR